MEISVVIPVFNKISIIKECIELNIKHCKNPQEWIIIDNASDQDTKIGLLELQAISTAKGHSFTIYTETENTGVAKAWNKGLSLSKQNFVCILNNDCVMMPHWDSELIRTTTANQIGISTPFVVESWMFKSKYELNNFLIGSVDWRKLSEINKNKVRFGTFTGVVFFGKKTIFDTIGPFDETFWLSLEEYDYLLRAKELGIKSGTIGAVVAFHLGGITRNEMKTDGGTFNQNYFQKKWGWNFEKEEQKFPNKQIRSIQKFLFKRFNLMSELNLRFPSKIVGRNES